MRRNSADATIGPHGAPAGGVLDVAPPGWICFNDFVPWSRSAAL